MFDSVVDWKELQEDFIERGLNLSFWFGVNCNKCCDVFPLFESNESFDAKCRYICPVCGSCTDWFSFPWQAVEHWNDSCFIPGQLRLF